MGGDGVSLFDKDADDAARHGSFESGGTIGAGVATARPERTRIVEAVGNAPRAEVEGGFRCIGIEHDAIRLAGDEQGKDTWSDKLGVCLDGLAIYTDAPLSGLFGRLDFNLAGAAANFEVEGHPAASFSR